MYRSQRAAYTLLEIMLVMAVIVILTALTYPSLDAMYGQSRITAGGDAFKAALLHARAQAVEDGVPYRVGIVPGKGNFRAAPDLSGFWSGTGQSNEETSSGSPPFIYEETLPKGVVFSESGLPVEVERNSDTFTEPEKTAVGDYKSYAVYLPDGSAREDFKVLICARNGLPIWVSLRSLTGEVRVTRYEQNGGR